MNKLNLAPPKQTTQGEEGREGLYSTGVVPMGPMGPPPHIFERLTIIFV